MRLINHTRVLPPTSPVRLYRRDSAVRPRGIGLGDVVAAVAQPIARAIDKWAGTHIEGCGACAKRRAALNRILPDIKHPLTK